MSSNIQPPDMENLLADMAVKARLILENKTLMKYTAVRFKEARETYYSAMTAYLSISKQRKHMNELIAKTMNELGRIHKKNGTDIRGFALKQNPKGMRCTTENELYTFFILRNFGGYLGRLYISNEDSGLLLTAAKLNLVVSEPKLESADNAEVLNAEPPIATIYFHCWFWSSSCLADMVVKARLILDQRTGMERTAVPFKEARDTYYSAIRAYLNIIKQRKCMNELIAKTMNELGRIHKKNGTDIRRFALNQNPKGMRCTTQNELYTFFILRKFGGYLGRLHIWNDDSGLLQTAAKLNIVASNSELESADNAEVLNAEPPIDPELAYEEAKRANEIQKALWGDNWRYSK